MGAWYESLESQLHWVHRCKLMKIVQPSPQDWRNLTIETKLANPNLLKDKE